MMISRNDGTLHKQSVKTRVVSSLWGNLWQARGSQVIINEYINIPFFYLEPAGEGYII